MMHGFFQLENVCKVIIFKSGAALNVKLPYYHDPFVTNLISAAYFSAQVFTA